MSIKSLYKRKYSTIPLTGDWKRVFGQPEDKGCWLIYGDEKNGKTWFALMLADLLSKFLNTRYISAEEGDGMTFQESVQRSGIDANSMLKIYAYIPLDELYAILKKKRSPKCIFIDNITVYNEELKNGKLRKLLKDFPDKLFVFVAHMENNEPYTATAKMAKRLAKVIVRVEGLACQVFGRVPGGMLYIHKTKAKIYHGEENTSEI